MSGHSKHGNREIPESSAAQGAADRSEKDSSRTSDVHGSGKSDRPVVPTKPANKAEAAASPEEPAEGRGLTKGNALQNHIYEEDFLGFSYGFRPGRSQHDALDALWMGITTKKVNWVLDADICGFLETSSYYTPAFGVASKRLGWLSNTLMRRPLRLPRHTCTA